MNRGYVNLFSIPRLLGHPTAPACFELKLVTRRPADHLLPKEDPAVDGFQLTASLVQSLVWPVTFVIALVALAKLAPGIFPFVERLKYKDLVVEFRQSVKELAAKSSAVRALPVPDESDTGPVDRLYSLAEISPRSAILEAWLQVESAAAHVLQAREPSIAPKVRMAAPLRIGELLNTHDVINGAQLEVFHRLRDLRNKAVHIADATFQSHEVAEYIELAALLAAQIRKGSSGVQSPLALAPK